MTEKSQSLSSRRVQCGGEDGQLKARETGRLERASEGGWKRMNVGNDLRVRDKQEKGL